jgi:hypothetical protein
MNPSSAIPWTYPSPARKAGHEIGPAACPELKNNVPPGSGSGSLGEFIEKIDSERIDKSLAPSKSRKE